jgi:hypothetical protein
LVTTKAPQLRAHLRQTFRRSIWKAFSRDMVFVRLPWLVSSRKLQSKLAVRTDTSSAIVTGVQHLDLSKILLTVYDPRIPRLGPSQRAASQRIEVSCCSILLSDGPLISLFLSGRSYEYSKAPLWNRYLKPPCAAGNEHCLYGNCYV